MCASANTTSLIGNYVDETTLMRATCTDETWTSDACPKYCLAEGNSK